MKKRFLLVAVLAITLAIVTWKFMESSTVQIPTAEPGITVGKVAPSFTLNGLNGNPVTVGKTGKITMLNFWATWCPPCRQEMPELEVFANKHKDTILFAAINLQEPTAKVKEFLEQNKYSLPVLLDGEGQVGSAFLIRAIPTTIVLDKNGIIKFRKSGPVTAAEMEAVLKEVQEKQ